MSLQTIKEGQMYKRGKINTEWRQRLFVLNGKQLAYFKGSKHAPSGIIELKDIRSITDVSEDGSFKVVTPDRIYEIRTDSRDVSEGWIEAIHQAKRS